MHLRTPRRRTPASPWRWHAAWISHARSATCDFSPRPRRNSPLKPTRCRTARSITRCVRRSAWWRASRHGTCRCTCLPGKIAPALAAGNTVVAKPSEVTPRTASMLGALCERAGLPAGVLNIVHGHGAEVGQALVEHAQVRAISFTGSTRNGVRDRGQRGAAPAQAQPRTWRQECQRGVRRRAA